MKLLVTSGAGFLALTDSLWVLLNPNSEGIKVLLEKGSYNRVVRRKTTTKLEISSYELTKSEGGNI